VSQATIDALLAHKRFADLGIDPEAVRSLLPRNQALTYPAFVSGVFDLYRCRKNKPLVADKTPPYVRKIDVLSDLFPEAAFLHQIRDGRDVCLSMMTWRYAHKAAGRRPTWQEDPVTTCALWWEWQVRKGREDGAQLAEGRYAEIRYEALVSDPTATTRRICHFLGIPFEIEMLNYSSRKKTPSESGLSANAARLPPTPGLRDWRRHMPEDHQLKFEAAVGPLLDELGLERRHRKLPTEALVHAQQIRDLFFS